LICVMMPVTGGASPGGVTGGVVTGGVVGVLGVEGVLGVDGVLGVEGVDGVVPLVFAGLLGRRVGVVECRAAGTLPAIG
jgi:hypothetical protein